jgi:hypothetical protein
VFVGVFVTVAVAVRVGVALGVAVRVGVALAVAVGVLVTGPAVWVGVGVVRRFCTLATKTSLKPF